MKKIGCVSLPLFSVLIFFLTTVALADNGRSRVGIGFKAGWHRIEGDLERPSFASFFYGSLKYSINPSFSLEGESGYGALRDQDNPTFEITVIPFELNAVFNFSPLAKIKPYAVVGGGGVYWKGTTDGKTDFYKGVDSFLKTGGGLEFVLSEYLGWSLGATFRYALTDRLDNKISGDENDKVVSFYTSLTYYFPHSKAKDRDHDGIPDSEDLAPDDPEDKDGFRDNDGIPDPDNDQDGIPDFGDENPNLTQLEEEKDSSPPVVIHYPIKIVEEGANLTITARVFEERQLLTVAVLFRRKGDKGWEVLKLKQSDSNAFKTIIPRKFVRRPGLEYCVVAVDEAISGLGYYGLPNRPITVKVIKNSKDWRTVGGAAALLGWGAASYLILRKQKW